jgi:hypothetical protein
MRGSGLGAISTFLALTLLGASGASIPLTTDVTVRADPCLCSLLLVKLFCGSRPSFCWAQKPITVPWDPSLRPKTDFLPLDSGLTADNTTGNEPSQVQPCPSHASPACTPESRPCWISNFGAAGCYYRTPVHAHLQACSELWRLLLHRSTCQWRGLMRLPSCGPPARPRQSRALLCCPTRALCRASCAGEPAQTHSPTTPLAPLL